MHMQTLFRDGRESTQGSPSQVAFGCHFFCPFQTTSAIFPARRSNPFQVVPSLERPDSLTASVLPVQRQIAMLK